MAGRKKVTAPEKEVVKSNLSSVDELASTLQETLNKNFKDFKAAYILGQSEESPVDLTDWVSFGSELLNLAVSNRPNAGAPCGRIIELQGMEGSGKSLIAAHMIADTQRQGGIGVFIDTENAASLQFMEAIGVDLNALLYVPLEKIEDIFDAIERIVENIRLSSKNRIVTIVVDSATGATTKVESESDFEKDGWSTAKAIIMSKAMRKITGLIGKQKILLVFTNQLREKLSMVMLSEHNRWTTSGGHALAFHASTRIRLKNVEKLKILRGKVEEIIGMRVEAYVFKNRIGPPHKKVEFDVFFDSGIDDINAWLELLKRYGAITVSGAWHSFPEAFGDKKFQSAEWKSILQKDPVLKKKVYDIICRIMISTYKEPVKRDSIIREVAKELED